MLRNDYTLSRSNLAAMQRYNPCAAPEVMRYRVPSDTHRDRRVAVDAVFSLTEVSTVTLGRQIAPWATYQRLGIARLMEEYQDG